MEREIRITGGRRFQKKHGNARWVALLDIRELDAAGEFNRLPDGRHVDSPVPEFSRLTESLNAKIQEIKYRARGYRNRDNFRLAILFHCGRLDMNPR